MLPNTAAPRQPAGSVLLFTLVILLLLGLMGFSLMLNTRTELGVSHNTHQGRDAFKKADLTARVALFAGRAILNAAAGSPCDFLRNTAPLPPPPPLEDRPPYQVLLGSEDICSSGTGTTDLSLENITWGSEVPTLDDILERYLRATASPDDSVDHPHVQVLYGGQVVGTAALVLYYDDINAPGGSLGENNYESQGENSIRVHLVVSADGRLPRGAGPDAANFFSGENQATRSIITAVFREIVVN